MSFMRALLLLVLLTGCTLDPGDPCEATGDGFTRQDPCSETCVEWEVECADGSRVVPGVCSGADCTADPTVCGPGWGCAAINMTDSACLPPDICPGGFALGASATNSFRPPPTRPTAP